MNWIDKNKEGTVIGGIAGAAFYYMELPYLEALQIGAVGWPRLALLVFMFATAGALIDSVWRPNK